MLVKLATVALISLASPVFAQGTGQVVPSGGRNVGSEPGQRTAVPTRPSSNPFADPVGRGVPPAVSTNPFVNSRRTNVPLKTN